PGAAQECAAVEALRLAGERGGERAAACLMFTAFDQHVRLLSSGTGSRDRRSSRARFPCSGLSASHRWSRCPPWRLSRAAPRPRPPRPHPARAGSRDGRLFHSLSSQSLQFIVLLFVSAPLHDGSANACLSISM